MRLDDLPITSHNAAAPVLGSAFQGIEREHGFVPLRVEGRLPESLIGTLYRNGPSVFNTGRDPHWFDGNGAVSAVRLDGRGAQGAVKVLHSPNADYDAGRRVNRYGAFRQPMSRLQRLRALIGQRSVRNNANINVLAWQGRLFALDETTVPLELDPETLATRGETDLDGVILHAWNAHPRRVPARRTTYQFGLRIGPKVFLDLYALPDAGRPTLLTSIELPGVNEVHDFFVTENHLIVVLPPLWGTVGRLLWGGSFVNSLQWQPGRGTKILVIPIDRPQQVTRLTTEAFFFWHGANAYEREDGRIVLDVLRHPNFGSSAEWHDAVPFGADGGLQTATLWRGEIDLAARRVTWEERWAHPVEFAAPHPARQARAHNLAWMAGFAPEHEGRGWWDRLVRIDMATGRADVTDPGPQRAVSEPILVARSRREDDVWVLSYARDLAAGATWLGIWDGARPGDEPVAKAWFDQQLPPTLHGTFVPA